MKNGKSVLFVSASLLGVALILYLISIFNSDFARFVDSYLSAPIRRALSFLSSFFPFSLFEASVVALPVLPAVLIGSIFKSKDEISEIKGRFLSALGLILFLPALYILTVLIAWRAPMLSGGIIDEKSEPKREEYLFAAEYLISEIEEISEIEAPISEKELRCQIEAEFENAPAPRSVSLPAYKRLLFSPSFSRLGIYGAYSFYTAEININSELPSFLLPFCAAHEYSHFLGASGEADANFLAFFLLYRSEISPLKYSALIVALKSILVDISKNNGEMYIKLYNSLPNRVKTDLNAWREFNSLSASSVGKISSSANGAILGAVDKNGKQSYSLLSKFVATLITASVDFA